MSRTHRRTKIGDKYPWWIDVRYVWVDGGIIVRSELNEKQIKRAKAKFHSDHDYNDSPSTWWRKNEWHKYRQQSRQEMIRWFKDEEHEVQIRDNPRWPWWD
jgi:hypothetical protein